MFIASRVAILSVPEQVSEYSWSRSIFRSLTLDDRSLSLHVFSVISSPTNQRYVTSGGLASARHDSRTSVPSSMRPPFRAPPITAIFTFGAYFTSSLSRTDRYVRSAVFCAWQVKDVLWCSFFGVSFRIDLAVKRRVSPIGSFTYSMPLVSTVPSPSIQVISAAGLPPTDTHSSSISRSSVVTRKSPCTIFGGSGGTNTVSVAKLDLMPGVPAGEGTLTLTILSAAHLALVPCLVVQHQRVDLERVVALLVAPDHRVAVEAAQVPVPPEPEVILRPLELAHLRLDPAGQRHPRPHYCRLVLRFHRKLLHSTTTTTTAAAATGTGRGVHHRPGEEQRERAVH
uniref:Uncharacterized protein n=1 Tax=Anopheles coluzzii TaxID=1518534 RepID=A0A8W7P211_ANOCL